MKIELTIDGQHYMADLHAPLNISMEVKDGIENPNCYYAEPVAIETIRSGDFIGKVSEGGSVNYVKLTMTPHGNGTHTECFGHISAQPVYANQVARITHHIARLITISPQQQGDDWVVTLESLENIPLEETEALIIRTTPNDESKLTRQYSGTNPPYLAPALVTHLSKKDIKHLLVDLPSVDKEVDEGKLLAHRAFWSTQERQSTCTITELIYVPNNIQDGLYLLDIQIPNIQIDACPSRPLLYKLIKS